MDSVDSSYVGPSSLQKVLLVLLRVGTFVKSQPIHYELSTRGSPKIHTYKVITKMQGCITLRRLNMTYFHRTSEAATRALYFQRINGLGKCMMLWASQYYEPDDPWNHTEFIADRLSLLLNDMASMACAVDSKSSSIFWKQMELILSKAI